MRFLLITLIALTSAASVHAQKSITRNDFQTLIPFLEKEDYKNVYEQSKLLLATRANDSTNLHGIVLYMHLYAAAGMVAQKQMSYKDLIKELSQNKGQYLVMPARLCTDTGKFAFNVLHCNVINDTLQGAVIAGNDKGTSIFFLEYYRFDIRKDPMNMIGHNIRCGGFLESFETNPNESLVWIARMHLNYCWAREAE